MDTHLTLKHLRLRAAKSVLQGWFYDHTDHGLQWSLREMEETFLLPDKAGEAPHPMTPSFYRAALPLDIKDWMAFVHRQARFDLETDEEADADSDALPTLHLCSHLSLLRSDIAFGARGQRLGLGLAGADRRQLRRGVRHSAFLVAAAGFGAVRRDWSPTRPR